MSQTSPYNKNSNLGSPVVKNKILKYLYSKVSSIIKHECIAGEKDLNNIRDNDYIICPRFRGTRSWIIFFRSGDEYYAVNFPQHSQRKKQELFIHSLDISVTKDFYYGTVMEGIFFKMDENKYLIIDEVYLLAGENQLLKPKDDRLAYLSKYLTENMLRNPTYNMYVSQFFQTDKTNLKELYEKIKNDTNIQEIIFYPKIFGRKIYSYTIIDTDLVDNVIKISSFRMQKTENPDVYKLLTIKYATKIGIAYIPDIETSKKCKSWFKHNKCKELVVKCQMDMEKKKWVPIELVEQDIDDIGTEQSDEREIVEV